MIGCLGRKSALRETFFCHSISPPNHLWPPNLPLLFPLTLPISTPKILSTVVQQSLQMFKNVNYIKEIQLRLTDLFYIEVD